MSKSMIIHCPNCKYEGPGKYFTKGSFLIELCLWFIFIVPGFIYSIWRLTNKGYICPRCSFGYVVITGYTDMPNSKLGRLWNKTGKIALGLLLIILGILGLIGFFIESGGSVFGIIFTIIMLLLGIWCMIAGIKNPLREIKTDITKIPNWVKDVESYNKWKAERLGIPNNE